GGAPARGRAGGGAKGPNGGGARGGGGGTRSPPRAAGPARHPELNRLRRQLETGDIPHAVLLSGPPDRTWAVAEFLAQVLVCTGSGPGVPAPCGQCPDCRRYQASAHPDVHLVRSEGGALKTAAVEELQEALRLRAHSGGRTVYVLAGIDGATPVAANRLLKTLEEPSPGVVAILTAEAPRRVLPTIRSRCFEYRLTDDPAALFPPSGAEDASFAGVVSQVIQWTEKLLGRSDPPLVLAESLLEIAQSVGLPDCLGILSEWLRDVMHWRIGSRDQVRFSGYEEALERQARLAELPQWAQAVRLTLEANTRLQAHVISQLNVDQLCIRLRRVFDVVHSGGGPLQAGG
ncbi:MAG: hypothetical protein K6T30_06425, partial [Alicyclobacillus sp.]|nr:hypothetical protein [Alicyclobacillus sp.]